MSGGVCRHTKTRNVVGDKRGNYCSDHSWEIAGVYICSWEMPNSAVTGGKNSREHLLREQKRCTCCKLHKVFRRYQVWPNKKVSNHEESWTGTLVLIWSVRMALQALGKHGTAIMSSWIVPKKYFGGELWNLVLKNFVQMAASIKEAKTPSELPTELRAEQVKLKTFLLHVSLLVVATSASYDIPML